MKIRSPDRSIIMPGSSTLSFYYILFLPPSVLELALHISILPRPPPLLSFSYTNPSTHPLGLLFHSCPYRRDRTSLVAVVWDLPHIRWIRGFRVWAANWQSPSVLDIFILVSFGQWCCSSTLTKLISITSAQTPLENVWKSKLSTYRLLALEVFLFYFYFYVYFSLSNGYR